MRRERCKRERRRSRLLSYICPAVQALLGVLVVTVAGAEDPATRYVIEVAAQPTLAAAERQAAVVRGQVDRALEVRVEFRATRHVVEIGDFDTIEAARVVVHQLLALDYDDVSIMPIAAGAEPEWEGRGMRTDAEPVPEPPAREEEPADVPGVAPAPAPDALPPPVVPEEVVARKQMRAARINGEPPSIDGRLDDAAWESADFYADFLEKGARSGFTPKEDTEVAVLYDDEALYVGARIHTSDPSAIRARRSQRNDAANQDRFIVSLDTFRNRETAYNFGVTAGGTRLNYFQPRDVFEVRDYTFEPVWQAASALVEGGWTAEMRIPFSSLRFHGRADSPVWGINVQRVSPALRVYAFWVVVPGNQTGWASRFGDLVGLEGVRPVRTVALVPYSAGQTVRSDLQPSNGPFDTDGDVEWRFGGDVLADLTPNLSLAATFNPDFGQIEVDPAVVNLTAFETFFPERRPFFLESAQLLQGPGPQYYYSRRIGAAPRGRVNAPFRDVPVNTTISGAAQVVQRRPTGWSLGALVASTEEARARTFDPGTEMFDSIPVEPRTWFGVSRVQRDFGAGSTVGLLGTGVRRDFPSVGSLADLLPREAYAGGADWNLRFGDQSHEFGGFIGGSMVEGEPAAILRLQQSSARYLQRPDASHVGVDPDRTSLRGYTAGMRLGRIRGNWRWRLSGEARSPGFEINDAGAMRTADDIGGFGQVSYYTSSPVGLWRRIGVSASVGSGWNFDGVRQYSTPAIDLDMVWRNFARSFLRVAYDTEGLSDSLTRGGPLMGTAAGWRSRFSVSSNPTRGRVWSLGGSHSSDGVGSWSYSVSPRFLARFGERYTFSVTPGYERASDRRQFYATLAGDRIETFNQRFIFATLDQETAYTRLRLGLAITRRLGLDLYVEPFAARGKFDRFGELAAARSQDLRLYGRTEDTTITRLEDGSYFVTDGDHSFPLPDGDFNLGSLLGNAVLRWEYAPGSTLFFVWSQSRAAEDVLGEQVRPRDLVDLLDAPVQNVFAVKASYRLDFNR